MSVVLGARGENVTRVSGGFLRDVVCCGAVSRAGERKRRERAWQETLGRRLKQRESFGRCCQTPCFGWSWREAL